MSVVEAVEGKKPAKAAPKPGRYRHFKGKEYDVLSVAWHSETQEALVVYRAVDDPERLWARPIEMFVGTVEAGSETLPRFQRISAMPGRQVRARMKALDGLWRRILATPDRDRQPFGTSLKSR